MRFFSFKNLLLASVAIVFGVTSCQPVDELSKEAQITSFTFDTSIEANSIVTSQPVIEGNTITFTVSASATDTLLSALVPTITVSEGATVSPASGSSVDFSNGPVTFTVTAQDGTTNATYTATATFDEPTFPIDEQLAGEYKGLIDITLNESPVGTDIPKNITVAKVNDTTVSLLLEDFSFEGIVLGTIQIDSCFLSLSDTPEEEYQFSGGQTLSLVLGELPTTVNGTFSSDGSIFINIAIDFNGIPVDVTFNGTKLTGNESSEALITSFTFDASNSANAAVHSTTIDQENTLYPSLLHKREAT